NGVLPRGQLPRRGRIVHRAGYLDPPHTRNCGTGLNQRVIRLFKALIQQHRNIRWAEQDDLLEPPLGPEFSEKRGINPPGLSSFPRLRQQPDPVCLGLHPCLSLLAIGLSLTLESSPVAVV